VAQQIAIFFDGGRMNFLHHLTLLSAVSQGYGVTVYTMSQSSNIPNCVRIKHVDEVMDPTRLASLSDARLRATVFQYEALAAINGVIAMRFDHFILNPLDEHIQNGRLFGWQSDSLVSTGLLALPQDSPALAMIRNKIAETPAPRDAHLGAWGSQLLTESLTQSSEITAALPKDAFHALDPATTPFLTKREKSSHQAFTRQHLALPIYHDCLLPHMRDDFNGIPRYWSALGYFIRENNVRVRPALVSDAFELPDTVWDKEVKHFDCVKWDPAQSNAGPAHKPAQMPSRMPPQPDASPSAPTPPAPAQSQKPQFMPAEAAPKTPKTTKPGPVASDKPLKVMIVTTMRNEAPFILEWVAYHRSIGITDFVVYTNDCDDGTVEILDALAERGLITARIDNPYKTSSRAGDWQRAALWDLQDGERTKDVDWVIPMDVDEYINIHTGNGTFADLVRAVPDADMISMVWRLFGNNFVNEYEDKFITEQFDRAALDSCSRPALAWGFKTAFKPNVVDGVWSVHRPKKIDDKVGQLNWYTSSGQKIEERFFKGGWRLDRKSAGYDMVTLNHYSLRSSDSYLVKKHRGRVNHTQEDQDISYFFRMNHNVSTEQSIANKLPAAKSLYDSFLQDETLKKLHSYGVEQHKMRIKNLKNDPEYQGLYSTVTSDLLRIYSRVTPHFGNWIFTIGPKSIPHEYEDWARKAFADDLNAKPPSDPPGLQSSGTILPKPEYLDEINENRKANLGSAKELGVGIFKETEMPSPKT